LEETSGLTMLNDTLWTHNDSGNEAALYALSTKGKIIAKKKLYGHKNIDWEDITTANGKLVVADMGNNFGTRKNLYLLEVAMLAKGHEVLDSIPFYYPEQENFGFQQATPFDAEGLIYIENNLVVFTKNRSTKTTEIYIVSKDSQAAKKIGSLPVGSLITGADYHQKSNTLVLTGYGKEKHQQLYVINDFTLSPNPNLNITQFELDFRGAQIEAVCIIDEKTVWITSEQRKKYPAFLAKIALP
tara:strand:+ start:1029 stop:1757 length:729 start_codon:yes stop_codon:yes gene_type:complete